MSEDSSKVKRMKPLASELEHARREIERLSGDLPEGHDCPRCFGSGIEVYPAADGYMQSRRCDHSAG